MDIRQTKQYLKRTGPEEFVVGDNVLDPLARVSGHNIIVDGGYVGYISGQNAWGWGGESDFGFASSGNLFATGQALNDIIGGLPVGGGGGGGGINGGPIFITEVTAPGGVVKHIDINDFTEDPLLFDYVWTGISTAEDSINVDLLIERGDSQNYKPTGVAYYQENYAAGDAYKDNPTKVPHAALTMFPNNSYSWETTVSIPTAEDYFVTDALGAKRMSYFFKNGDRVSELKIVRDTLPVVQSAMFMPQELAPDITSIYPPIDTSFVDEMGGNPSAGHQQAVKVGDTVKVQVWADKEFKQVVFQTYEAISAQTINVTSSQLGSFFFADLNITISSTSLNSTLDPMLAEGFRVKVVDLNDNESIAWFDSQLDIIVDNTPSYLDASPVVLFNGQEALTDESTMQCSITITNPYLTDLWNIEIVNDSVLEKIGSYNSYPSDGDVIEFRPKSLNGPPYEASTAIRFNLFNAINGIIETIVYDNNANLMIVKVQQFMAPVTFTPSALVIKSGPWPGFATSITATSDTELQQITMFTSAYLGGTVQSVNEDLILPYHDMFELNAEDTAPRSTNFSVTYDWTKISGETGSSTIDNFEVRGFTSRMIEFDGAGGSTGWTNPNGVAIGAQVVNTSKINGNGTVVVKIQKPDDSFGDAFTIPYSAGDTGGVAEFGLTNTNFNLTVDADVGAQIANTTRKVQVTLREDV